jgi:hypothetical protein
MGLLRLFLRFEHKKFRPRPDAFKSCSLSELLRDLPVVQTVQAADGTYPDDLLSTLRTYTPEVLLSLGNTAPRGPILGIPAHGVWSYDPPGTGHEALGGLDQVLTGNPVTYDTLYRLREPEAGTEVLSSSVSPTEPMSFLQGRSRRRWKTLNLAPRLLRLLCEQGEEGLRKHTGMTDKFRLQHSERIDLRNGTLVLPLLRHFTRLARRKLRRMFVFDQWILLFAFAEGLATDMRTFRKMLPPRNTVWADPHIIFRDNRYYIFIEECPLKPKKGRISVIEMQQDGTTSQPRVVIDRPYHLSYPFLFEWDGALFMIPESSENRTVELYRCSGFPYEWTFEKNLMTGIEAVDSTLLYWKDKWWLFATVRENDGYPNWDELFLFHSDTPVSDHWTPHPLNPVISDVTRARPAGRILEYDGVLYRPSQDCSRRYGYGTRINRIETLNDEEYVETEVDFLEPTWDKRLMGVHTLAQEGKLTVIDALYRRPR